MCCGRKNFGVALIMQPGGTAADVANRNGHDASNRTNSLCNFSEYYTSQSTPQHVLLALLQPFNGLYPGQPWVSRYQKGKPFWILLEQEMMGWQRHQLDHHLHLAPEITIPVPHQSVFTGRMPFLRPNQQHQITEGFCSSMFFTKFYAHIRRKFAVGKQYKSTHNCLIVITRVNLC